MGLSAVPVLPYLFDHPVEKATDVAFDWIEKKLASSTGKKADKEL